MTAIQKSSQKFYDKWRVSRLIRNCLNDGIAPMVLDFAFPHCENTEPFLWFYIRGVTEKRLCKDLSESIYFVMWYWSKPLGSFLMERELLPRNSPIEDFKTDFIDHYVPFWI